MYGWPGNLTCPRRAESAYRMADLKLKGLDPEKQYTMTNLDTDQSSVAAGRALMEGGFAVEIAACPGAVLFSYRIAQ